MALTREQALLALKVIRCHDPVVHFFGLHEFDKLCTETQWDACASGAYYKLVTTANQGGKTTGAIFDCAALARGIHPTKKQPDQPISILIVVPSRAQAAGIWGKRLLTASDLRQTVTNPIGKEINLANIPLIPPKEVDHVDWSPSPQGKYPGLIRLKNGNEIRMGLSGDVKSWERVQGFPLDAIYRDEAVGNKNLGAELVPRLTAAQGAHLSSTRNWGGFIYWVATATLPNTEFEEYKQRCLDGVQDHAIFWMDPNENPAVSAEVRDRQRNAMSAAEASVRLDGTGSAAANLRLLPDFSVENNVLTTSLGVTTSSNIWLGYDPGWDHPYGLVSLCIDNNDPIRLRLVWCKNERGKTLEHIAEVIATYLDGRVVEAFVFDPAAKKTEHGRGESVAFQMEKLLAARYIKSERGILFGRNRFEDTLPLLQSYINPPDSKPLLVFDAPTEENNTGTAINQFMKYRKKATNQEGNHPPLGATVYKYDDDLVDPIRYVVSRRPNYVARNPHPVEMFNHARPILLNKEAPPPENLSEDMRIHLARLKYTDSYPDSSRSSLASMPTGHLHW